MAESWGIYGKIAFVLVLIGVAISLGTYLYYTSYIIIYSWESLPSGIREIYVPFLTLTRNLLALISVAISVIVVFSLLLFLGRGPFSRISTSGEREHYSLYFVLFVTAMIIVSEISSFFYTQIPSYEGIVLNFQEQIDIITLSFMLQVVPITVMTVAFGAREKSVRNYLLGNARFKGVNYRIMLAVTFIYDAGMLYYLTNGISNYDDLIGYIEFFLMFIMSNIIYMKFGFWRAYLANFTFASIIVISNAIAYSYALSLGLSFLILVWVLAGFLVISNVAFASLARKRAENMRAVRDREHVLDEEIRNRVSQERSLREVPLQIPGQRVPQEVNLWVRGGCPSCGNPTFKADTHATLTCLKCGREVTADEEHPQNIMVVNGRIVVAMQRESSNDDLYS